MGAEQLCSLVLPLAEHADVMPPNRFPELLGLLQQGFVSAFKESKAATGPGSPEEAKLTITRAVRQFHVKGPVSFPGFFTAPDYHQAAALFIHTLLQSLAGNSKEWFRELQIESMMACLAIVNAIGREIVRQCLPGVVSGAVRYISRSHLGKDSAAVRHGALDVLQRALVVALSVPSTDSTWVDNAVSHLSSTMREFLEPTSLVENAYDRLSLLRIRQLIGDVLATDGMKRHEGSFFTRQLLVAYMVVENMIHLSPLPNEEVKANSGAAVESMPLLLSDSLVQSTAGVTALCGAIAELRGVELLHLVTSLARFPTTRAVTLLRADPDGVQQFLTIVKKCVRVVGTQMAPEDIYTSRAPRRFPAGVVDEFLECLAHSLSTLPEDREDETAGEVLTNALLDSCEAALEDWDLYGIHPPTIYVLTRLVVWQFKPVAVNPAASATGFVAEQQPLPADFTTSGAFEQLWTVVAKPHLWDIVQHEELCTYQQVHHRQVVAATILRFLSVTATTVLAPAVRDGGSVGEASFYRFVTLVLYFVMEKAATTGIVHEAAMACAQALFVASGRDDAVDFFLDTGVHLIDEAARAVKEPYLRPAAASVLRGAIEFAITSLGRRRHRDIHAALNDFSGGSEPPSQPPPPCSDSASQRVSATAALHDTDTHVPVVVKHRLSAVEVAAVQARYGNMRAHDLNRMADFTAAAVQVAMDCCRLSSEEGDAQGTRATLALLKDAFDIAAILNFCSPLEASDDDQMRQTTSANLRVQLLQEEVQKAILLVLTHCFASGVTTPNAVQAVIRGLTAFLTTRQAETWTQEQIMAWNEQELNRRRLRQEERGKRKKKTSHQTAPSFPLCSSEDDDDEGGGGRPQMPPLVSPPMPWFSTSDAAIHQGDIALQRSHLKTVYRAYLSFVALLKEPVSRFLASTSRSGKRRGEEKRQLEAVPVTPALFATLSGLEALLLLATDFLEQRMVEEVLPLALVWYEKGALPRIPTNTDERVKHAVQQFALALVQTCSRVGLRNGVRQMCKPFFRLARSAEEEEGHVGEASEPSSSHPYAPSQDILPAALDDATEAEATV